MLARAGGHAHRAVLALTDSAFALDRAESRSVLAEALLARALAERSVVFADSAMLPLIANGEVFSPALTPRAYRRDQVLRVRLQRVRWQLSGDPAERVTGGELAVRTRDMSLLAVDSLVLRLALAEMKLLGVE